METIGMSTATTTTTTTTSGGEIDSRISSSGGVSCCSKVAPTVASPSIDFQSSSEQQQQQQQEIGLLGEQTKPETVKKTEEPVQDQEPKLGENKDTTTASPVQILNSDLSSNSNPHRTCETRGGDVGLKVDSDCDGDGHGHGHANGDGVECKDSHNNSKSAQNESEKRKTANHSNCVSVSDEKQKREDGDNDSPTTPVVPCSAASVTNLVTVATTDTETGNSAASCCTHNNNHHHHSSPRRISSSKSHETDVTLDNRLGSTPTPTPPIVPNFCVEGSGDGDSSVTVVTLPSSAGLSGSLISGSGGVIVGVVNSSSCLSSSLASDISCSSGGTSRDGTIEVDEDDCDNCEEDHDIVGLGGNGSGPLSVQSSEDMKLSLVSWYSEPEDSSRGCCQANLLSRCVNNIDAVVSSTPKSKPKSSAAGSCSNKSSSKKTNHHHQHHHHISSCKLETNGDADGSLSVVGGSCDEKENKTPVRAKGSHVNSSSNSKGKTASKMHVQLLEQQNCGSSSAGVEICSEVGVVGDGHGHGGGGGHQSLSQAKTKKLECPRCCARRSKSGTTTPANGPPSRTLRRVVQSSKSSGELKKPIKSILKSDSRGSGSRSGSGSEKQSSMDSLGSSSGIACVMTRSEGSGGVGRTKFNFNSESLSSSSYSPEEKTASKLKRIEKYATLRLRKSRVKPLEFDGGDGGHAGCPMSMSNSVDSHCHGHCTCKHEGSTPDVMSKSMSFLEKSTSHCTSNGSNHNNSNGTPGPSSLKRQGSLRIRKPSPMWEPSGTRTSALRMQKMQEAKAKTSSGNSYYNNNSSMGGKILFSNHQSNHSGSNHSGSGESIHTQHHHHNHHGAQNGHQNGGHGHSHSSSNNNNNNYSSSSSHNNKCQKEKQQHLGAKVFTKLSSASGQTTSSAMKRLRQERAVQTDPPFSAFALSPVGDGTGNSPIRISPVPAYDQDHADDSEQIKNLEILAQRYRNTALRFQHEFEKSEVKNRELAKQLAETQSETSEMIDFLQAEKSTLAESLVEIENEGKKWQDEVDSVKKESQSRCSSLVRLSEQHKQEALKSQALLNRLEAQSNTIISKQSSEISEAALTIQQTRLRIVTLIEKLLKTYKVSHELITAATTTTDSNSTSQSGIIPINSSDETDLNSSLLLPLISSLLNAFPMNPLSPMLKSTSSNDLKNSCSSHNSSKYGSKENDASSVVTTVVVVDNGVKPSSVSAATTSSSSSSSASASAGTTRGCDGGEGRGGSEGLSNSHSNLSSSLQNLNQAILEREAAEMDFNSTPSSGGTESGLESIHDGDHLSIKTETEKLNRTLAQLVTTIRIIVIHCDKKVSGVTSNILQCLRSIEEEKGGKIPEMVSVQKSLEAWSGGMRQCNSKVTSPTTKIFLENGHSHA